MWRRSRNSKKVFLILLALYLGTALLESIFSTDWLKLVTIPISYGLLITGIIWLIQNKRDKAKIRNRQSTGVFNPDSEKAAIDRSVYKTKRKPEKNQIGQAMFNSKSDFQSGKKALWKPILGAYLVLSLIGGVVVVMNSLFSGRLLVNSEKSDSAVISDDQEARFFGTGFTPLLVGYSLESGVKLLDSKFEEDFWEIVNVDEDKEISTYFSRPKDFEEINGLFVCTQSIAPGVDIARPSAVGMIRITVSASCRGREVQLAMGPAASFLGRYVPPPLNAEGCYRIDDCEAEFMDGILISFLDGEYQGHKTANVLTAYGEYEIELAMIDLASEWCGFETENEVSIYEKALELRDQLLPPGSIVRLVGGDVMSGGRRIVHRLDEDGVLIDGPIPENSVNEQLVASGYWVPLNISKHPWERILYTYDEEMANPKWEDSYSRSEPKTASEKRMSIYSERITSAANSAYSSPNAYLGSCLEQKSDQVAFLLAQKEEEEQRNEDNRRRWAADVEAVWRSVFCPTMAEDFPKRCAKYNPEKDDKVGTGGGSGSSNWGGSGGGSNCTWVNSYTRRDGTRVSGYFRCG